MELSKEQLFAYEKWREGENIFITGPGGCGKTHLIQYIYQTQLKNVVVCALTGCAAVLLDCNAQTIHSWSGVRLGKETNETLLQRIQKKAHIKKRWKTVDCLIIDEISMMSVQLLETLDFLARHLRKQLQKPFGGIQVIFSGDFYQLPPISDLVFCFESPLWNELFKKECHIELNTIFRQKDEKFQKILNQIRKGVLDKEGEMTLRKYLNRPLQKGLEPTKLYPIRKYVDSMNSVMFQNLDSKEYEYPIFTSTKFDHYIDFKKEISENDFKKCQKLTPKQKEIEMDALIKNNNLTNIILKRGTFIMSTKNINVEEGICNGSQGVVIDFINGKPLIRFLNGLETTISIQYFQSEEYPSIVVGQYPLQYAWAMTIHKIQGSTLDCAEIDIGQNIFSPGQSYVALSRLKSFDGLYLKNFVKKNICAHPRVTEFYKQMNTTEHIYKR